MKKFLCIFLLILSVSVLFSQTFEDLDVMLEFDTNLSDLGQMNEGQLQALLNKFFIFEGTVYFTEVYNPDPEGFQAMVELVSGSWKGLDDVVLYHGYFLFFGQEFASAIPARPPRPGSETPDMILNNRELTVLCQLIDYQQDGDQYIPVFQTFKYKIN